jgi:dihydroorotate dehydrogenase (fumarate)
MDLSTTYLGLQLPHPFMPGASPLTSEMDTVRRLEDAGTAALVMPSLFEEQIMGEHSATERYLESPAESFAEATTLFPQRCEFTLGPDDYLEQLRRIKEAVDVPVIGSLNGTTARGWLEYATLIEQTGADALELNVYEVVTNPEEPGETVEGRTLDMLRSLTSRVSIPMAVKISPFYSALAHFASQLDDAGASGLVLFNRFYQPNISTEDLEVFPAIHLSNSSELLLRLRWLAILSGRLRASLAVSGGVHTSQDAIKAIMAGADAAQIVSALLRRGPEELREIREEVALWLEEHEYDSLEQMRGSMNLERCPDPGAFERGNYIRVLQS